MKARITLGLVAVVAFATTASAAVLWDQSNYVVGPNSLVDEEFLDYPTYSSYMMMDVTASTDWTVDSVSIFLTDGQNGVWQVINQARLNVFSWTPGSLPAAADDPSAGTLVSVTMTDLGDTFKMTASGLDLDLAAGNYWIGLAPQATHAQVGQEFHRPAPIVADNAAWRNPGGAFGYGTGWNYAYAIDTSGEWQDTYEGAILIEGIPAPGALALLGLAGLVSRRRR